MIYGVIYYDAWELEHNKAFWQLLKQYGEQLGHSVTICTSEDEIPSHCDYIFFRSRDTRLSKILQNKGYRLVNQTNINALANDKLQAIEMMKQLGISTVPTFTHETFPFDQHSSFVMKTRTGYGGNEVFLLHSLDEVTKVANDQPLSSFIFQPYIETNATDVRVFVLGNQILGAVKRSGIDSFKSNFTLGGTIERFELAKAQIHEVEKIVNALKPDYIGLDFLLLPTGEWIFNEMEDPVGARSLYKTTTIDVAYEIMNYIHEQIKTC